MMNKKTFEIIKFSLGFFLCFFSIFVSFGCSQVTPEVISPEYSVIFEYNRDEKKPNARMSFFVEAVSDVRRFDSIKVICENGGYIWEFNDITRLENQNRQWAGNTNLVMPKNEVFPSGKYEITFKNADEKETSITMNVSYDSSFYSMDYHESEELLEKKNGTKKIAIYDKDKVMIYFADKNDSFNTSRGIWNLFSNAKYYQDIWMTPGNNIICIMPLQEVTLDN